MGIMDVFKKKSEFDPESFSSSSNLGLGSDPLTQDNTGLNLQNSEFHADKGFEDHHLDSSNSSMPSSINKYNEQYGQSQQTPYTQNSPISSNDLQMISLKLDAIKSEIDSMNQRLKNIEMIAEREQQKQQKKWY